MPTENNLVVLGGGAPENGRWTRRKMVQRLLTGAGAAWPLVANSHPVYDLLRDEAILAEADKLGEAHWKPVFLSSQQNEAPAGLPRVSVPGSVKAQVNRFIDLLLSVDKPENQREFVESLTALDAEAQKRFGKHFAALQEEQKSACLTEASTKPEASGTNAAQKLPALYGHFENLKGWISGAYYSSEAGMRELGWREDYAFAAFPGCTHPEGHH
jgi:Gluconate 2-dehydrogenase subunit 3